MTCVQPARVVELSQKKLTKNYPPNSQNKVDPIQIQRSLILGVVSPNTAIRIQAHPSHVHSRVFSNECNSNNFSRIQHNVFAASTHACSQHPRLQPAPTLAASTHACSQHPRMQPAHASRQHPRLQAAPTLAGSTHACRQHPRVQPAPPLPASTHACSQHPRLQPAPTLAATMTCLPPA